MNTLTITWSSYNNYGTLLQAYALQKKIEQLGHKNVILSDKEVLKAFFSQRKNRSAPVTHCSKPNSVSDRIRRLEQDPGRIFRKYLAKANPTEYEKPFRDSRKFCNAFRNNSLYIRYGDTIETLETLNEEYDVFICGSDQIWSVFDNIFNPYYYLDFAHKKKIAYAPSLGTDRIPEDTAVRIRELLSSFSSISVRELISSKQLTEITGHAVTCVADPTLLHDRHFWEEFAKDIPTESQEYILCYFLENKPWYFDYARAISKKLKLRLLLVPNKWDYLQHSFVAKTGVGPAEFVALFRDAEYILTDSYHGSIFSVIFEKQFLYLQRFSDNSPDSQNIRIQSLFGMLGLTDRIISQHQSPNKPDAINYGKVSEKVGRFRTHSISFLSKSLAVDD